MQNNITNLEVKDNPEKNRYELDFGDGGDVAVLNYSIDGDVIDMQSVVVPELHRNQGIARLITQTAFDSARDKGMKVIATCPYVKAFVKRYKSEYADMVINEV